MTDSESSSDAPTEETHHRSGAVYLIVATYMEDRDALWLVAYYEESHNTPTRIATDACLDMSQAFRFLCRNDYNNDLKGKICQSFFTLAWCEQHVAMVPYIAAMQQHQQPQFVVQLQTGNVSIIQDDKGNKEYHQWIIHKDSTIYRAYSKSPFLYMEPLPAQITLQGKGMHRTLSYEINFSETVTVNHTMIQFLQKEVYVEHEMNYNCRIRSYDTHHSCHIIQHAQPKVMDIEQPSFVSSQHVIAYNIVAQMNKQMDSIHRDRTIDPTVIVEFDTTIHFRYPLTDNSRMIQVIIDPPYLLNNNAGSSSGENHYFKDAYWKSSNVIVTTIPAGSDKDLWYVSIITALVVWFGSIKMLRDIIRISSKQRRKKQH